MAVARLGSVSSSDSTNALAHTIAAGTDRALIVAVTQEVASPTQLAVGYGGQSMSAIVGIAVGDATDQRVDIYFLNDSGIAAAADNQIDVTSPPSTYGIFAQAYEGCIQTTPTTVDSEAITGDSDPLANIQISSLADHAVFGVGGSGNTSTGVTWAGTNPLTVLTNIDINATAHGTVADRLSAGSETVNHSLTFTTAPNRVAGAAFLLEPIVGVNISTSTPSEFDMDTASITLAGSGFGASQGSSVVYLSPNDTVAEAGEVDVTSAVNTWSDTSINMDLTQLTAGELTSLHTMGPGARFWIVDDLTTEDFMAVTLHRPIAFQMVLGNIVPGTTTARITGLSGTFAGGRAEETAAQNPSTTTTNVAANGNREDVWSIEAKPLSRFTQQYDFRVLYGGVVASTITRTPQVTVEEPAAATVRPVVVGQAVNRAGSF